MPSRDPAHPCLPQIIVLRTAEQHLERAAATLNRRAAALYLNVRRQDGGAREPSSDGNGASGAAEKHDTLYHACRTAVDSAVQAVIEVSGLTADLPAVRWRQPML